MIAIISAMTKLGKVIGKNNWLPWEIPDELKHFRQTTLGGTVIMGRKTYDSVGRPMPKRHNIVISRNKELVIEGVDVCHTMPDAIKLAKKEDNDIWIIGGAGIYEQGILIADKMYLSYIKKEYEGDTYFPEWNKNNWEIESSEDKDEWELVIYRRKKVKEE
jgi:dihydrofolate reductase